MGATGTGGTPLSVDRDLLELMVAYGFVPSEAVAGVRPAAARSEAPDPRRTPAVRPLALAVASGSPRAGRTTIATGLAHAWSRAGRSVLLVDLDPSEELGRLLLLGSAITVNTGQLLLHAITDGGEVEPSRTVLPGVDLVSSGSLYAWDSDALPSRLRGRPTALRAALGDHLARYDRVIVDVPNAPVSLWEAAMSIVDEILLVVAAASLVGGPGDGPARGAPGPAGSPKPSHLLLSGFDPGQPPAADRVAALRDLLDTAIPRFPQIRSPWDVIGGAGGTAADDAFTALAAELDAR
ncbi:MAG: cellulose synthase operon protein YhjQ/BcsQ [Pseudomonadota bacterium]|nr:cellulose synthase operon protein YhjQ/BcsQ [Pseudomonadota bacterium]